MDDFMPAIKNCDADIPGYLAKQRHPFSIKRIYDIVVEMRRRFHFLVKPGDISCVDSVLIRAVATLRSSLRYEA